MRRGFSYNDAVTLLGGDSVLTTLVERLSAVGVLATGGIELLDARIEVARLGKAAVSSLRDRVKGLHRVDRTRLLEAAHSIVLITALFEALDDVDLPVDLKQLKITRSEQITLFTGGRPADSRTATAVEALLVDALPLPGPQTPYEVLIDHVTECFTLTAVVLADFILGLDVEDQLSARDRERLRATITKTVPPRAVVHYEQLYSQLERDCPEFAVWTAKKDQAATRLKLDHLHDLLASVAGHTAPDERRQSLAKAHRAALDRPLVESGDLPHGLTIPTLGSAYVAPVFRVAEAGADGGTGLGSDLWWARHPVRTDVQGYLAGYFASSQATRAPLVVLGQPGSGKSVLTKMLAALLPPRDFLPIRVVLREAPVEADLQSQVEHAIRDLTGERLDWPALTRAAGRAVPVVMLDGFDELLQATGVSRTDYLVKIREFQRREHDQGRSVIVLVTSRTAVADRATVPEESIVLRLEPFQDDQVRAWLDVWNETNSAYYPDRSLSPLTAEVALEHDDLARQPLLLFMLALYDAEGNPLQREHATLGHAQLYEELITRFARREVVREIPGADRREVVHGVNDELVRLSVVAFAMFNRGAQWVGEADLDRDLANLLPDRGVVAEPGTRRRLSAAELVVGRFFFIHEARAAREGEVLQTYEFLHATFGEYLVARLVHRVLCDLVARERAAAEAHFGGRTAVDDDTVYSLLSFAPVTTRAAVVGFLLELFAELPAGDREILRRALVGLLAAAQYPRPSVVPYEPRRLTVPTRIAAYTANLVLLLVIVGGPLTPDDLPGGQPSDEWRRLAQLWRSQLTYEEWNGVVAALTVDRTWPVVELNSVSLASGEQVTARFAGDGGDVHAVVYDDVEKYRRATYLQCDPHQDLFQHALEPLAQREGLAFTHVSRVDGLGMVSRAHLFMKLLSAESAETRHAAYEEYVDAPASQPSPGVLDAAVLRQLVSDQDVPVRTQLAVVHACVMGPQTLEPAMEVVLNVISRSGSTRGFVALEDVLSTALEEEVPVLGVRAIVRLVEMGRAAEAWERLRVLRDPAQFLNSQVDLGRLVERDPGLVWRLRWAMESAGLADQVGWPDGFGGG